MTTRITNTLHETAEAVDVPAIDQLAFQQRVRVARRRHYATRSVVAVAASVALAAGVGAVVQLRASDEPGGFAGNPGEQKSFESMQTPVPFLTDGNLMILPPGGKPVSADLKASDIVGQVADGVIIISDRSRLLRVPLDAQGRPTGPASPVVDNDPVQRAMLSKDGRTIGWIDLQDRLHLRRLGEQRDFHTEEVTPATNLVAVAADSWLVQPAPEAQLRLTNADGSVELRAKAEPHKGEIAGGAVVAEGFDGVEFFAAPGGEPILTGGVGGLEGALSPDGSTYVAAATEEETDAGMSLDLTAFDASTGKRKVTLTPKGMRFAMQMTWSGSNFLVLGAGGGTQRIYECSVDAKSCQVVYTAKRDQHITLAIN